MSELETQVAKIQIGDPKQASTYAYMAAEVIPGSDTEIYILCELPLFNPAAIRDCEHISEAVTASLRRFYRRGATGATFENALAQINDELGKLASIGKTHWVGKLNAIVAAKQDDHLSIATVGKITALLLRDNTFSALAESTDSPTPLKTFENFAVGKLRLNDLLIFSTSALFNHVSVDRVRHILEDETLPDAAGTIIDILHENAGPDVACATLLALQVEPGQAAPEMDVERHAVAPQITDSNATFMQRIIGTARSAGTTIAPLASSAFQKLRNQPRPDLKAILSRNKSAAGVINQQFKKATATFRPDNFRAFSNQKKFFFLTAALLLIALVISIGVTRHYRSKNTLTAAVKADINALQKLADDANAAIIYHDETTARQLTAQLHEKLNGLGPVSDNDTEQVDQVRQQADQLDDKINKRETATITSLGTLSNANNLIVLPNYLATEVNRAIVSYNRTSGSVQDNALKVSEPITASIFAKGNQAVIYNGSELFLWNFQTGIVSAGFSQDVPNRETFAGLKVYATRNRAYMIDKANSRVMSYAITETGLNNPAVSVQNIPNAASASDLAIDGNVYILSGGTITKYTSGALQNFSPALPSSLSAGAKAYTQSDFKNLYILDPGNKRIIILDKQGGLIVTLVSPQFTNLKDFTVDEAKETIYVLNDSQLLKVSY